MVTRLPSLIIDGNWIPSQRIPWQSRTRYVQLIMQECEVIFPDYHSAEFPCLLGKVEPVHADIALVSRDNRSWWVVFVVSNDFDAESLKSLLETAKGHDYGSGELRVLLSQNSELTREDLKKLILQEVPSLIVVTDNPLHNWSESLPDHEAKVVVVEPFWYEGKPIIRVDGEYPWQLGFRRLARCERDSIVPYNLQLVGDIPSAEYPDGPTMIWYKGSETNWILTSSQDRVHLLPAGSNDLANIASFEILEHPDGYIFMVDLE